MSIGSKEAVLLSARETDVLHWLYRGKSNWEISQHTVKHHVSNILQKLKASNRQHAAIKGAELGLLEHDDCQ